MKGNENLDSTQLSKRQFAALPHILSAPTYQEAARRAQISPKQIHEWMKDPTFCMELKKQRHRVFCEALTFLRIGSQRAVETLVELLDNEDSRIRLCAADKILMNAFKGAEMFEILERINDLEVLCEKRKSQMGGHA